MGLIWKLVPNLDENNARNDKTIEDVKDTLVSLQVCNLLELHNEYLTCREIFFTSYDKLLGAYYDTLRKQTSKSTSNYRYWMHSRILKLEVYDWLPQEDNVDVDEDGYDEDGNWYEGPTEPYSLEARMDILSLLNEEYGDCIELTEDGTVTFPELPTPLYASYVLWWLACPFQVTSLEEYLNSGYPYNTEDNGFALLCFHAMVKTHIENKYSQLYTRVSMEERPVNGPESYITSTSFGNICKDVVNIIGERAEKIVDGWYSDEYMTLYLVWLHGICALYDGGKNGD